MKKTSKVLLTMLCAVLLVAASVMGTLAYLTSADTVLNTFTVGDVEIDLWEHVADENGAITGAITQTGNTYEEILPGHTYSKDPTVTVKADSEACYVRMLVTVTYDEDADEYLAKYDYKNWFDFSADWTPVGDTVAKADGKIARTYEFRYNAIVAENDTEDTVLPALFTEIKVNGTMSNDELATLDGLQINIVAQAIQADGFANADAAWAAFN